MEVTVALVSLILIYFAAVICRWAFNRHRSLQTFRKCDIPGPKPSFFSGNLYQIKAAPTPNDVISRWLKEYGDVFGYFIGGVPHLVIKDRVLLKQVMMKESHLFLNRIDFFISMKPLTETLIGLKDKRWKEVRSIITPLFTSGKIKLMMNIFQQKVDTTMKVVASKAEKNEMFDIYKLMQGLTLDVIAGCALAMNTNCQENPQDALLVAVRDFFRYANNRAVDYAIMFPFIGRILKFIADQMTAGTMTALIVDNVKAVIKARRSRPEVRSMDMLQLMLDHNKELSKSNASSMKDDEILANAYLFLLAGYETTATALTFIFYLLIKHPDIQEKLYEEISTVEEASYASIQDLTYLDQVFSESLRIYPPVTGFITRKCNKDCKVGPYTVLKDTIVQAPIWDIQHDPDLWEDPWRFDPERFAPENKHRIQKLSYFPFGIGPRNCIGARFAQLEAKLSLFQLIRNFRFEMCEKTDDPLNLICPTVIINPANGVYVRAVART